jgi:hypothetical protein
MEVRKDGVCIAECSSVANAVLFHAAPEMYEALQEIVDYYEAYNPITDKRIEPYIAKVKQAIAKAEGGGKQ